MLLFSADTLRETGTRLFLACSAPKNEAEIVADELVDASLMGLDSHGIMRYPQYVQAVQDSNINPGAPIRILRESPTSAVVDCNFNFGIVSAIRMTEIAGEKGKTANLACVVSRNSHHIGRLGTYVQKLTQAGLLGIATCSSSKHAHWVVPWGGREGRLATNPIAYGVPTSGDPLILDMSTSAVSEGKIRILMHRGEPVPEGSILDASGDEVTDPKAFYGPPKGAILPLGGKLGYKGFGLALLADIFGSVMAGVPSSEDLPYVNGLAIIAINPDAFCPGALFIDLIDDLCAYQRSSPPAPGYDEVVLPGTLDFRTKRERLRDGIPVAESTWNEIVDTATDLGISLDAGPLGSVDNPGRNC